MKKNIVREYFVIAVLFVLLSIISFVAPFEKNGTFWCGYVFAVIAIFAQLYFFRELLGKGKDAKSRFYGFPIAKVGSLYLVVQVILSFIQMIAAGILASWVAIILNAIVVAFAVIGCIAVETVHDEIVRQDVQIKTDVKNMRNLQSLSANLSLFCNDDNNRPLLQKIADEFKYSDPVSSEQTLEMENMLLSQMRELQRVLEEGNSEEVKTLGERILSNLAERNRLCKLKK